MNDVVNNHETISALADGQLRGEEFARALEAVTADADARSTWHTYHLVGDVLRSGELAVCRQDAAFMTRLKTRLQYEAALVQPAVAIDSIAAQAHSTRAGSQNDSRKLATNESSFRWKLVAGFASLAAVVAIGWNSVGGLSQTAGQPQLAQALVPAQAQPAQQPVAVADNDPQVMIRDPRLNAFLAAHEQFGGTSALQMPAGFLRNATFEGQAR